MESEASGFETSEMLASVLASTPLISESWRLCTLTNKQSSQCFVAEQIGDVWYLVFSAVSCLDHLSPNCNGLVPLDTCVCGGLFPQLNRNYEDGEAKQEPVMVHAGWFQIFMSVFNNPCFQEQITVILNQAKSIVITGHSLAGTTASLCTLWLLCYLQNTSVKSSVLCITFGSPLLGNESLSRAILHERWSGNFCHVVSSLDIMPRLLFAPVFSQLTPQLYSLVQLLQLSLASPQFALLARQINEEYKSTIFRCTEKLAKCLEEEMIDSSGLFWPFGNYFFCSEDGAICLDSPSSVIKMMYILLVRGSPSSSIEDHLNYGSYVEKLSWKFLTIGRFSVREISESSYEAGLTLALQASNIPYQEPIAGWAKDCLRMARQMGRAPNLTCASLSIKLSKITPYRAEIEWYKASCEKSDDRMGYYDSFKHRGASRKDHRVNMNRHKLGKFWDDVINMLETNKLPHDFLRRAKWVNASHFYKLLVEPLDIAEYYRTGTHRVKGHYIDHGRERRYRIFDKWWNERTVPVETNRSKFASLTQDTCFWAKVEEARDWLDSLKSETNLTQMALLVEKLDAFAKYASAMIERKEVSRDVVLQNSSYSQWVRDYESLKPTCNNLWK